MGEHALTVRQDFTTDDTYDKPFLMLSPYDTILPKKAQFSLTRV